MLASPSLSLQLPYSYQRHTEGFDSEDSTNCTKSTIITPRQLHLDTEHSSDIDDRSNSHSLSARSMSSLATTVDSTDYEKGLSNVVVEEFKGRQMSSSSIYVEEGEGGEGGKEGEEDGVGDTTLTKVGINGDDNANHNGRSISNSNEITPTTPINNHNGTHTPLNLNPQKLGKDTFYDASNYSTNDSLLTITDSINDSFTHYKGLKLTTKSSPTPDDIIGPTNGISKNPASKLNQQLQQPNGSLHSPNLRTYSTPSIATANVLKPQLHSSIRNSIDSPPSPNFRSSTSSFDDKFHPRSSTSTTTSYHSIPPISPVTTQQALLRSPNPSASSSSSLPSLGRVKTVTDGVVSGTAGTGATTTATTSTSTTTTSTTTITPISPTSPTFPTFHTIPTNTSTNSQSTYLTQQQNMPLPHLPIRSSTQQIIATNRNSLSSQRSNSSQDISIRRVSLYSHRTSFSFSRRKSTTLPLPPAPHELDRSATALEIERLREEIITQRELRRRRKEYLEDERVLMGTKVSEGHVNYVTAYNMLTGIRVSVSRCNGKVDRELNDDDFRAKNKLAFDVSGNELTPSARYDFKFKDYSPWVFRHLRQLFKLDPADYLMSLTSKYIVSELGSPGKSGSFFYFSRDYRFIIKTIHHSEHKMLRKILKDYYNHVKNNPNTLISQFYGLHRVKLPFGRKIHFIVMNNLFPPHRDIHRTYDLKGSTLGRRLVLNNDNNQSSKKKTVVYKDLNWIDNNESIMLGPIKKKQFLDQIEIDVALLKRLNIMDYSLLIGIHDLTKGNTENIRDATLQVFEPGSATISKSRVAELRKALVSAGPTALAELDLVLNQYERNDFTFYADSGGFRATDENNEPLNDIYYLGIIDCLTPYTFTKRVETFWKGLSNIHITISAIPAAEYGDRFSSFIKAVVSTKKKLQGTNPIPVTENSSPVIEATDEIHLPVLSEASTEARSEN